MSLLSVLFPSASPVLALAHFVALFSPGLGFFLLVGYAAWYRMRSNAGLCVRITSGNGLYVLLAIIGWGILRQLPLLFTVIKLLDAPYLLWIGSLPVRSRPQTLTGADTWSTRPGFGKQLLLGPSSSLLSPKSILSYLALVAALLGPSVTLLQQAMSGIRMTNVVLRRDLLIAMFIGLPQIRRRLSRGILWVERIAGGVSIIFGCAIALRFLPNTVV